MNPEQFPLLKIRRQPEPDPELCLSSEYIRAYVAEKIEGFAARQAERDERRQLERNQDKRTAEHRTENKTMRVIKVSFRAVFEGPKGVINPMGAHVPGRFPVEVFQANKQTPGNKWKAREIETARRNVYERLRTFASAADGKQVVEQSFDKQLEPWQMWGVPPGIDNYNPPGTERLLLPEEIHECAGGVYQFRGPEDFTHISPLKSEIRGNQCLTRCGAHVTVKLILSVRAHIAPTCPTCAGIYAQEYANA